MPKKTAPNKGWKVGQSNTKTQKRVRLGLFCLGLVLGVIFLGQLVSFIRGLFLPLDQNIIAKPYHWNGNSNLNFVVKAGDIGIVSYNPNDQTMAYVEVPDRVYTDVPRNFGKWRISSVFDLGQQNNPPIGNRLLEDSMVDLMGVPIDGYIQFLGKMQNKKVGEVVDYLRSNPLDSLSFLGQIRSDLTPWEILRLRWGASKVRFDKVDPVNLEKMGVFEENNLPDGTPVLIPDLNRIDSALQDFTEVKLRKENLSVAVFNGTDHPGLAQKAARIITNIGGNVIFASNLSHNHNRSFVTGRQSATLDRLRQIFSLGCGNNANCDKINCQKSAQDCQGPDDAEVKQSRAQVNVILGEDFYNRY